MFRRFSTIAIAAAMLLTASCTRENLVGNDPENDGMLKFSLSMSGSPASVLETKSASISTDDGTVSLPLSYERRDGIESRMSAAVPVTKGTQYNSAEQYEGSDSPAFSVVAWNSDGTPFIEDATEVTFTSNKWTPASSYKWEPEKDVKTFLVWANAPASGAGISNALIEGVATQTFTYTVPTDARQQNDVMLGWYKGDGGKSMTAEITMVHPLTAIQFKQGEMDMSVTAIRSISIEGLLKTGEATVTYASAGSQVTPSYSWTMGIATQTVTLAKKPEAESLEVDPVSSVIGEPFIVLPQKVLADKVKLSVVLSIGGTDRTLTAYLPAMDLKEGQTNVFTIGYKLPYNDGSLPGEFSVSPTKKVRFSPGNLYFNGSTFEFEANQYDYRTYYYNGQAIGSNNAVINGQLTSTAYSDWGLFSWSTENDNWGLIDPTIDGSLTAGNFVDWGAGLEFQNTWRTLSNSEYEYLLSHNKNGLATINTGNTSVSGTVIVPEGWTTPSGCSLVEGSGNGFNTNQYSLSDWQKMHINGAVFFPAVGYYYDVLHYNNERGLYWSSTPTTAAGACYMNVDYYGTIAASHERFYRCSVRLVTDVDKPDPSKVEFIDLGLPSGTLWANMNIGATKPEESGEWFMWGEVKGHEADVTLPKDTYGNILDAFTSDFASFDHSDARYKGSWSASNGFDFSNVPYHTGTNKLNGWSKYIPSGKSTYWTGGGSPDNKLVLDPEDDAAYVNWGGSSRMPTKAELDELFAYTNNKWISNYEGTGVNGYLFTNKTDEKMSIFLPAVGLGGNLTLYNVNKECYYWSSSLDTENPYAACFRDFRVDTDDATDSPLGRMHGRFVRAVKSPAPKSDVLPSEFSVSATKKVKFSKGNLYYNGSKLLFEANQYEFHGYDSGNNTWGHFGWSTNTTNYGMNTSMTPADYSGAFVDWGEAIGDGCTWYTLTTTEWQYLFNSTGYQSDIRQGKYKYGVTVCGKANCVVLLPDNWVWDGKSVGNDWQTAYDETTTVKWSTMEAAGAVCLPAAGYRGGTDIKLPESGFYWSSSAYDENQACRVAFSSTTVNPVENVNRDGGYSVRLVTADESRTPLMSVTGEVCTNYNVTNGPKEYKVKSGSPWKLQYTLDDGADWVDAKAGQTIDGWISFDKVSGIASDQEVSVKATVAPATSQTSVTVNHNDNLRNASYRGQNSDIASQQRPYDLSMYDIYGNPTQRNTANCYVISGPGLYAFPLVYGNAIKNGADNVQAYKPNVPGTNVLSTFQSATGDINSTDIAGVTSAAPLWEDVADWALVGENACKVLSPSQAAARGLTAGCGYVMFEVKADNLTPGNAVIAVRNSGGTILWSWHLWVTDLDLNTVAVTNSSSQTLDFMPYNLGWVDTENTTMNVYEGKSLQIRFYSDATTSVTKMASRTAFEKTAHIAGQSPTYQWGRKDPFIRVKDMSGNTELTKDEYRGVFISNAGSGLSSSESIKNPTCFAVDTYWTSNGGKYNNLWSALNSTTGDVSAGYSSAPVKTVYDPCPPGFQVPQANAVDHFSASNHDDTPFATLKGYNFYTKPDKAGELFYFPAAGDRGHANGAFEGVTSYSNYWFAVPFNSTDGYHLGFNSSDTVHPKDNNSRAYGFSVRPVKE